jgi:hypothetical protein
MSRQKLPKKPLFVNPSLDHFVVHAVWTKGVFCGKLLSLFVTKLSKIKTK